MKRRLPKVNPDFADAIFNGEDAEEEKKSVEDEQAAKKVSKKKKLALNSEHFKDGRFDAMFENKVLTIFSSRFSGCYTSSHRSKPIVGISFWFSGLPNR